MANATPIGTPGALQQMMQSLLADRFKLVIHRETRDLPVLVLVVDKGGPKLHLQEAVGPMGQNPFSKPDRGHLIGTAVTAEMLAKALAHELTRTVQDQTGLKGVFDFKLEWDPEGESLFTALREQLGLRLEARKAAVEVLVIDHLDSAPTEN